MGEDYYDLLGISDKATPDEIKKGYREKAKLMHPDKNPGVANAHENFLQLKKAYDCLKDPTEKRKYDEYMERMRRQRVEEMKRRFDSMRSQEKHDQQKKDVEETSDVEFGFEDKNHQFVISSSEDEVEEVISDEERENVGQQAEPVKILKWDPASVWGGSVTNNVFKRSNWYAYARASDVMSTQSSTNFEWSVKFIGKWFHVGIASQLKPSKDYIFNYDQDSILYTGRRIRMGSNTMHENVTTTGDIIHFKFEPSRKKLVIDLVRIPKC